MSQTLIRAIAAPPAAPITTGAGLYPAWSIDFTSQSPASAGLTFARASAAGSYNAQGNWVTALNDTLRLSYHPQSQVPLGFLAEESRTNYLLNSTSPVTQTVALGTGTYTFWNEGSGSCTCAAGTAVGTGFGTATAGAPVVFTVSTAGSVVFTVSGSPSRFQCENGTTATSFIATGASAATRAADHCSKSLTNIINPAEGTFFVTGSAGKSMLLGLDNGTGDGATRIHIKGATTERNFFCSISNSIKLTTSDFSTIPVGSKLAMGFSYAASGLQCVINGQKFAVSSTAASGLNVTALRIGHRSFVGSQRDYLNNHITQVSYYTRALPLEYMQQLTA